MIYIFSLTFPVSLLARCLYPLYHTAYSAWKNVTDAYDRIWGGARHLARMINTAPHPMFSANRHICITNMSYQQRCSATQRFPSHHIACRNALLHETGLSNPVTNNYRAGIPASNAQYILHPGFEHIHAHPGLCVERDAYFPNTVDEVSPTAPAIRLSPHFLPPQLLYTGQNQQNHLAQTPTPHHRVIPPVLTEKLVAPITLNPPAVPVTMIPLTVPVTVKPPAGPVALNPPAVTVTKNTSNHSAGPWMLNPSAVPVTMNPPAVPGIMNPLAPPVGMGPSVVPITRNPPGVPMNPVSLTPPVEAPCIPACLPETLTSHRAEPDERVPIAECFPSTLLSDSLPSSVLPSNSEQRSTVAKNTEMDSGYQMILFPSDESNENVATHRETGNPKGLQFDSAQQAEAIATVGQLNSQNANPTGVEPVTRLPGDQQNLSVPPRPSIMQSTKGVNSNLQNLTSYAHVTSRDTNQLITSSDDEPMMTDPFNTAQPNNSFVVDVTETVSPP